MSAVSSLSLSISDSQFYMWRTLFALAHVDYVVADEELRFMMEVLEDIPFSEDQRDILNEDIRVPQKVTAMFDKISEAGDKVTFFKFAHDMVWVDGDFGEEEQKIMLELQRRHVLDTDVDELIGKVDLQLEGDAESSSVPAGPRYKKDAKTIVHSFRKKFLDEYAG